MNAAVWLGAAIFFTFGVAPAVFSSDMQAALRSDHPYFPGAVAQVILARYFHFHLVCAILASLHLLAEWVYLGRPARKFSLALLSGLLVLTLLGGFWLQPKLKNLHAIKYGVNVPKEERDAAGKSFGLWHGLSMVMNLVMMSGLVVYVWRTANPSDTLRFVSSVKFRG